MTVTKNTTPKSTSTGSNTSTGNNIKIKNCGAVRIDERNSALDEFDELKRQIQKTGFGNDTIQVCSAVFLCTPEGKSDYRIALLWRQDTNCLQGASIQFGKVLYAATVCAKLRDRFAEMEKFKYKYLSPDCCQIGNTVSIVAIYSYRYYSYETN